MDASHDPTLAANLDPTSLGTKDGLTAADNDTPYRFGRRPTVQAPFPFSERQFARLLSLRSRLGETTSVEDRLAA
jgi:uncharacterized Fe-S cluster-containing radical SAM superfamily enzyme